jgi:hypothetical protein
VDWIEGPFGMLAVAAVFAGFFWWNMRTGEAGLGHPFWASRAENPIGFWLIQGCWGAMGLALFLVALFRIVLGNSN